MLLFPLWSHSQLLRCEQFQECYFILIFLYLPQGEDPLGAIHLRGCVVTAVEDMPDCKEP